MKEIDIDSVSTNNEPNVPKQLENNILQLKKLHEQGCTINANIENSVDFKNPYLLEKVMKVFNIKEYSSNYKKDVYNPDFYVALANDADQEQQPSQPKTPINDIDEGISKQNAKGRRPSGWSPETE
ncbi:HCNGP-like family protein [Babesia bovis T2Bo]|uniref:HCNGP-like family protein n=1 Tax=Babesia bovis TaxID=5865 RepID=A7AP39_BABBO|nr:HCNGP-like family protein [Babesia bovis T2Bo]EDO08323.1 HCNGP-like family protein [Babesia bovis T2Bo]|eukprot:XP_001611891.1 HCNGP-like family protein [Babesia bovis T2Bo]